MGPVPQGIDRPARCVTCPSSSASTRSATRPALTAVGGMSHATFLKGIELLGTKVLPQIQKELGRR